MYYLGIDLGGTNIAAGVVNEQYQIIGRSKTKTHVPCSEEEMCSQLAFAALSALEDANIAINEIEWIGIGSPGSIDRTNGMITFSSNLHFHQFPLERLLSEKLCKKVIIENDAKAAAYGEFLAGALKNANNALAITLGTGVGCGIIINKQIYRGSNASSGEMGHMVMRTQRPSMQMRQKRLLGAICIGKRIKANHKRNDRKSARTCRIFAGTDWS